MFWGEPRKIANKDPRGAEHLLHIFWAGSQGGGNSKRGKTIKGPHAKKAPLGYFNSTKLNSEPPPPLFFISGNPKGRPPTPTNPPDLESSDPVGGGKIFYGSKKVQALPKRGGPAPTSNPQAFPPKRGKGKNPLSFFPGAFFPGNPQTLTACKRPQTPKRGENN